MVGLLDDTRTSQAATVLAAISKRLGTVCLAGVAGLAISAFPALGSELRVQPSSPKPGDPVLVRVVAGGTEPSGKLGALPLMLYPVKGGFEAIVGLPLEQKPGPVPVEVTLLHGQPATTARLDGTVDVAPPQYPTRELTVAAKFTEKPTPEIQAQQDADRKAFAEAFNQPFGPRLFSKNFRWPRPPKITAPFGDQRTFNGVKQSQHYGTDLDGRIGDPILAANDGVVVMARPCFASGNTVIVSHGGGLFTLYFHMSKMLATPGQKVRQGQRLGLVGRTGRVTGPHLHWAAKVGDLYVDAATLLKLDFTGTASTPVKPAR